MKHFCFYCKSVLKSDSAHESKMRLKTSTRAINSWNVNKKFVARIDHPAVHLSGLLAERDARVRATGRWWYRNRLDTHFADRILRPRISMHLMRWEKSSRSVKSNAVQKTRFQIKRMCFHANCPWCFFFIFNLPNVSTALRRQTNKSYTSYEVIFMYVLRLASIFYDRQQLHI